MIKFRFLKDGEWVTLKNRFKFRRCDCGLIHDVKYRKIIGSKEVEVQMHRNERLTTRIRRKTGEVSILAATTTPDRSGGA